MDKVKVTIRLSAEERAALLRAARLKNRSMQNVLAVYSKGFIRRVRKDLENGQIRFE